jgi:hypothetical protein
MAVKKKAEPKKKQDDHITVTTTSYGYNALTSAYDNLINSMLPQEPENLEAKVAYWKDKYERSNERNNKLDAKVEILERIIDKALDRSCNGH